MKWASPILQMLGQGLQNPEEEDKNKKE
jgi:hypothetical protein